MYKQCVSEANNHQRELEKVKRKIIVHIRKLICQGDTVLKEVGSPAFRDRLWGEKAKSKYLHMNEKL